MVSAFEKTEIEVIESQMNTKKLAVMNASSGLLSQFALIGLQFVQRKLFLDFLGVELIGISGTITSIVAAASLAEGGVQSAIIYNLYAPLQNRDTEKINKLLNVYRYLFQLVGTAIIGFSVLVSPLLPRILTGIEVNWVVYLYFFLSAASSSASYFLSYKRALIAADRSEYITRMVDLFCNLGFYVVRIAIIVFLKSYAAFLIAGILMTVTTNTIVHFICKKRYPFLKAEKHDKACLREMLPQMRELFGGAVAAYVFRSSDNIVISKMVNTLSVGLLASYTLVTTNLKDVILSVFTSAGPMLGNIITASSEKDDKRRDAFNLYSMGIYVLAAVLTVPEFVLLDFFVENVWGAAYLLPRATVVLLVLDQYLTLVQDPCGVYIIADGQFRQCKHADTAAAVINIVTSVLLAWKYQIAGVLMGTIISRSVQWIMKSYYLNLSLNGNWQSYLLYWVKNIYKFAVFCACIVIVEVIFNIIPIDTFIVKFVLVGICGVAVTLVMLCACFWFTNDRKLIQHYLIKRR